MAAAVLETGYGPMSTWGTNPSPYRIPKPLERQQLAHFLNARAAALFAMFSFSQGSMVVRDFTRLLDASDKTAVHYTLGQAGANIAMQVWIGSVGIKRILHASALAAAMVRPPSAKGSKGSKGSKILPDLLVEDMLGNWHALEAKAGRKSYKTSAIDKGLLQLASVHGFQWRAHQHMFSSKVCSFVEVPPPNCALKFTVFDPPGDPYIYPDNRPSLLIDLAESLQFLQAETNLDSLPTLNRRPRSNIIDIEFDGVTIRKPRRRPGELADLEWRSKVMLAGLQNPDLLVRLGKRQGRTRSSLIDQMLGRVGLSDNGNARAFLFDFPRQASPQNEQTEVFEPLLERMEKELKIGQALESLKASARKLQLLYPEGTTTDHAVYVDADLG